MLSDDGWVFQIFIDNKDERKTPPDLNVYETVVAILEEFFKNDNIALVFICDSHDGRQAIRQRLFNIWFAQYGHNHLFQLVSKRLIVDDTPYFVNLLAKKDMPLLQDRIASLESLYDALRAK